MAEIFKPGDIVIWGGIHPDIIGVVLGGTLNELVTKHYASTLGIPAKGSLRITSGSLTYTIPPEQLSAVRKITSLLDFDPNARVGDV